MPTRYIEAARKRLEAARMELEEAQRTSPHDLSKLREVFKNFNTTTDEYVKAVDDYLAQRSVQKCEPERST